MACVNNLFRNITYTKGDQIWAGFQLESPVHGGGYEAVDGIFDWVATYRRDSDIYVPYGKFYSLTSAQGNTSLMSIRQSLRYVILCPIQHIGDSVCN